MSNTLRSLAGIGLAFSVALGVASVRPAGAQQTTAGGAAAQLPPAAQRSGNLPFRTVNCSYSPCGKRVSPQDGAIMQIKPNGQTPRDADGHPDLTGNWGAGFPNPIGQPGLRRPGGFEADQSAMQRGAQWNKPLYKPEYWEKVQIGRASC